MDEPPAKKARVHFGSLEEQEKKRIAEAAVSKTEDSDVRSKGLSAAVRAGIEAGNINIADGEKVDTPCSRRGLNQTVRGGHFGVPYSFELPGHRK